MEQEIQCDRGADHFGEVACCDRELADHPEKPDDRCRIVISACLREIAPGDDAKLRCETLKENRHQVRDENYAEQRVSELRSASQIGGPVSRVHIANRYEVSRAGEREDFSPPGATCDRHRPINLGQRRSDACMPPSDFRICGYFLAKLGYRSGHLFSVTVELFGMLGNPNS